MNYGCNCMSYLDSTILKTKIDIDFRHWVVWPVQFSTHPTLRNWCLRSRAPIQHSPTVVCSALQNSLHDPTLKVKLNVHWQIRSTLELPTGVLVTPVNILYVYRLISLQLSSANFTTRALLSDFRRHKNQWPRRLKTINANNRYAILTTWHNHAYHKLLSVQ